MRTLRRVRLGQVAREQGTLAIARLRLDEARACYQRSRELLAELPSERMHVAQAWIKEAQVELVAGRLDQALRCLAAAAPRVEAAEPGELSARVAAHYWKTTAWLALASGDASRLGQATQAHASVIAAYGWDNEHAHQRWLRRASRVEPIAPRVIVHQLVRAGIVAASGGGAQVSRWLRELRERGGR